MVTYPGLPGPLICDYLSREASRSRYAAGVEFQIGKIEMVANTGTYLDAPFHRYADGADLAQLPLECVADLDAVVVRVPPGQWAVDFRRCISRASIWRVRQCWCVPAGTATGEPTSTCRDTHFLPVTLRSSCETAGQCWSVSIPSTSTIPRTRAGRSTPSCSAQVFSSWSTCVISRAFLAAGFRFSAVPAKVARFGSWPVRAFGHVLPAN